MSVIIPAFNAAQWLPETVRRIVAAIERADIKKFEVIIVDDGSSDNTSDVVRGLPQGSVRLVSQANKGRFLARKAGVDAARYDTVWFVDTRVHVAANSLRYVLAQQRRDPAAVVWNGHVNVQKKGNIIARFMDAVTLIGWRRYFANPRRCSYGLKDFDYYPKGTGCFLVPKQVLQPAIEQFLSQTKDVRNSSDDTHLIRLIAEHHDINLSPKFSCSYYARTTLKAFVKHTFSRGRFFVDGFLRPGTRFFVPLILFFIGTAAGVIGLILYPALILPCLILLAALWLLELAVALLLRLPFLDAASLWLLSPLFAGVYGAGIWMAFLKSQFNMETKV